MGRPAPVTGRLVVRRLCWANSVSSTALIDPSRNLHQQRCIRHTQQARIGMLPFKHVVHGVNVGMRSSAMTKATWLPCLNPHTGDTSQVTATSPSCP